MDKKADLPKKINHFYLQLRPRYHLIASKISSNSLQILQLQNSLKYNVCNVTFVQCNPKIIYLIFHVFQNFFTLQPGSKSDSNIFLQNPSFKLFIHL